MSWLDIKLGVLHVLLLSASLGFSCVQGSDWDVKSPVLSQETVYLDTGKEEFLDEPFPEDYPRFSSDYSSSSIPYESHDERIFPHQSDKCPIRYELLDPRNIEETREQNEECSEKPVSCHRAQFSKFRTIDGSCNNLKNPNWGKSDTCLTRILPYDYADGKSVPRISCTKKPLPNARWVSNNYHKEIKVREGKETTHFLEWGQILSHDFSLNDIFRTPESGFNIPINCCQSGPLIDDRCISIAVPEDDLLYPKFGITCLNLRRTLPCSCNSAVRHHWNRATSYHDLSLVYGNNEDDARSLRSGVHGMLKIQYSPKAGPLPPPVNLQQNCVSQNFTAQCLRTGDPRTTQNIFLVTLHTMFLRYHNFLCQELHKINPHWDDEKLYQEARRIFIAQAQMITFGQYLPIVLGEFMDKEGLNVLPGAKYTKYNPSLDATIADEYTTVAARYGHSQIPDLFSEISTKTGSTSKRLFADYYFRPFRFYDGQFDKVVKGMSVDKLRKHDVFLSPSVRDLAYRRIYLNQTAGADLAAVSIIRGRDHGIPGYTYYLKYLFNITVNNFEDLKQTLPPRTVEILKTIYESVHDVELYPAGLAEYYVKGGFVGQTFATILSHQARRIKYGDRFWFEHGNQAGSFTPDQLIEIKRTSLARIICETTTIKSIQGFVFLPPSKSNRVVPCKKIPRFNLYLWKD